MVYGSSAAIAAGLRSADGHMKTSRADNLPIVNGIVVGRRRPCYGKSGANALQTLFVHEHNYQVDRL